MDMLTRWPSVVDLAGCPAVAIPAAVIPVSIMSVAGPAVVVAIVLDISTAAPASVVSAVVLAVHHLKMCEICWKAVSSCICVLDERTN
jgi:hypothetical protein